MSESTDRRPQSVRRILAPRVDCAYVADEAAAFALGALEPAERVNVERHIRACVACAALVADLEATAGLLPFAAPPAVPTAAAKTALFTRIAQAERAAVAAQPAQPRPQPLARPSQVAPLPTMLTLPASGLPRQGDRTPPSPEPTAPSRPATSPAAPAKRWVTLGAPLATIPLVLALALVSVWSLSLRDQGQQRSGSTETVGERLDTERSVTTGAEIDTGDGGVEGLLGLEDIVDDSTLNAAAVDGEPDLDATGGLLGGVYGGVDVGVTSGTTVNTLQFGNQHFPTGGEVPIG